MRRSSYSVVGRHQREHDRSVSSPSRRRGAAEENAGDEREQQVDINDRQPIQSEPVPVERAQKASAVGSRQVHEDVEQHTHHRNRRKQSKRRIGRIIGPPFCQAESHRDETGRQQAEPDDSERSVCRAAVPCQIIARAADCRERVDVGSIRSQDERGSRPSAGAFKWSTGEREGEQSVREIVHPCLI